MGPYGTSLLDHKCLLDHLLLKTHYSAPCRSSAQRSTLFSVVARQHGASQTPTATFPSASSPCPPLPPTHPYTQQGVGSRKAVSCLMTQPPTTHTTPTTTTITTPHHHYHHHHHPTLSPALKGKAPLVLMQYIFQFKKNLFQSSVTAITTNSLQAFFIFFFFFLRGKVVGWDGGSLRYPTVLLAIMSRF